MLVGAALLPLLWVAGVGQGVSAWLGDESGPTGSLSESGTAVPDAAPTQQAMPSTDAPDVATPPLAMHGDLDLYLPTPQPLVVGFHEASSPKALKLGPVGSLVDNENASKFTEPEEAAVGAAYRVLASRGRSYAATSAVDVVMAVDDPVRSPVDGEVTDVSEYVLYGNYSDYRLEIAPTEDPDLRVVVIHMDDLRVSEGDEVVAGETALAGTARPFPFGSQIDRYTEPDRHPHVHIEVKHHED